MLGLLNQIQHQSASKYNLNSPTTMALPQIQLPPLSVIPLPPLPQNPPTHEDFARALRYTADIIIARSQSRTSSRSPPIAKYVDRLPPTSNSCRCYRGTPLS